MRFNALFFLLVLSCLCLALAQTPIDNCCYEYVKELGQKTQRCAVNYTVQVTGGACNMSAVIFTMKKGHQFCANPEEKWVVDLRKKIDDKPRPGARPESRPGGHPGARPGGGKYGSSKHRKHRLLHKG